MLHWIRFYFSVLSITYVPLLASEVIGQPGNSCTIYYTLRNEKGDVMSPAEAKQIVVESINGAKPILRKYSDTQAQIDGYLVDDATRDINVQVLIQNMELNNSIAPRSPFIYSYAGEYCRSLQELTLVYGGKRMRLFFEVKFNFYRNYHIDSLPFQEGTFHLAPLKDHSPFSGGKIIESISADRWENLEKDWVRHSLQSRFSDSRDYITKPKGFCRNKPITVITTQSDLVATWKSYSEAPISDRLLAVDFRTEMVLITYGNRSPDLAITVDKKGDASLDLQPNYNLNHNYCDIIFRPFYRVGVKSVEGKPLPPAPER